MEESFTEKVILNNLSYDDKSISSNQMPQTDLTKTFSPVHVHKNIKIKVTPFCHTGLH